MSSENTRPTWRSEEQLQWIQNLTRGLTDALEIGTFGGAGAEALLLGVSGLVFSIEPLGSEPQNQEEFETCNIDLEEPIRDLATKYPTRFIHIAGRSEHQIWARPIDALVIDGDHSFGGVLDSAQRFATYVTDGGVVFVDAYGHPKKPDVKPAWDCFMKESDEEWKHLGRVRSLHGWRKVSRSQVGCLRPSSTGLEATSKARETSLRLAHSAVSLPADY